MTDKQEFRLTVKSPWGKQPLDRFEHWLGKVSQEAEERWGIEIRVEKVSKQTDVDAEGGGFDA